MSSPPGEYLALLAEVKSNPDDDTPRLVLADWLQDQGDPRGELLALDLERHRLPRDDPRGEILWQRERELLGRHAFEWLGPLIDLASHWTFQRGFLRIEARAGRFLTPALDELAKSDLFAWVEQLRLTDLDLPDLRRLARSPVLGVLSCLDLSDNRISSGGLARLLGSPRLAGLRELPLARNRLGEEGVLALANCPYLAGLVRLDLAGNRVTDAAALALVQSRHLANLRSLDVRGNAFTSETMTALLERFGQGLRAWAQEG
jgi:uncharacterized protein (TIGR02996 family)